MTISSIGKTYLNNNIYSIKLSTSNDDVKIEKTSMLFTGAHHARELTSISMNVYLVLRLVYDYMNGD